MLFANFILASLTVGTAVSSDRFYAPDARVLGKRQGYPAPAPTQCGVGDTCESSCGPGTQLCSDPTTFFCYNPAENFTCCQQGSSDAWACPDGDYCLINGYCCPKSQDPKACAQANSVTLPATFSAPTTAPRVTTSSSGPSIPSVTSTTTKGSFSSSTASTSAAVFTGAATTTIGSFSSSTASTAAAVFTGAASSNIFTGGMGFIYGVVVLIGNLV